MGWFLLSIALAGSPDTAARDIPIPEGTKPAPDAEARRQEATARYLQGLDAWKQGRWSPAWRLASEALALDPELTPARLLVGYALVRLHQRDAAVVTLAGLELEPGASPLPADKLRSAAALRRRLLAPRRRDQWWIGLGNLTFVERMAQEVHPLDGWVASAQAPLPWRPFAVRASGGAPWGDTDATFDVRGPRFDLLAIAEVPVGGGVALDLGVGPTFWLAEGGYWPDGSEPYLGGGSALGADLRFGGVMGLRLESGVSWFPEAEADLPWYREPLDVRIVLQGWFGR